MRTLDNKLVVFLYRALQAGVGALSLIFCLKYLPPADFGTYQSMVNFASLSNIIDLGMLLVLSQLVAGRISIADSAVIPSDLSDKLGELAPALPLIRTAFLWCIIAGCLLLTLIPFGIFFFDKDGQSLSGAWVGPWVLLIAVTALQIPLSCLMSGLEGASELNKVYMTRLLGLSLGGITTWACLIMGGGMWAAAMMPLLLLLSQLLFLWRSFPAYCSGVFKSSYLPFRVWREGVWPFQWRSAMSWLSGYGQMFIHVPVVYHYCGAADAGRLGATITLVNTVSVLALAIPTSQTPQLIRHATMGQRESLAHLYRKVFRQSVSLYLIGGALLAGLVWCLQATPWHERLLPLDQLMVLLFGVGFYHVACVLGVYVRVHLQDPMAKLVLLVAFMTAVLAAWGSRKFGPAGVVWAMLLVNMLVHWPLALRYRYAFDRRISG